MDMNTIIGSLLSGYACKVYAAGMAVFVASEAVKPLMHAASAIHYAFP